MSMRFLSFLFLLLSVVSGVATARAGEAEDRKAIGDAASENFRAGRFAELDAMADHFRTSHERTGSGAWKLSEFYNGLRMVNLDKNFDEASFERYEVQALRWTKERPQSVAAKLAYAMLLSNHKWYWRGYDYWPNLTPAQREGFKKYHVKERDYLVAIKPEASIDPQWYSLMMEIAAQEVWPDSEFDRLTAEALEREPYYRDTWYSAIDRNLPEWGGSYQKVAELIRRVAKASRPLEGDTFIARGYWHVYERQGREASEKLGLSWSEIDKGFHDLVRYYPSQWNINAYAKFACVAQDRQRFIEVYARIEVGLVDEIWGEDGQPVKCAVWAHHPERNIQFD